MREAKLAEREILFRSKMAAVADPEARETLDQEYRRDRERITSDRDRKIEEIRAAAARSPCRPGSRRSWARSRSPRG